MSSKYCGIVNDTGVGWEIFSKNKTIKAYEKVEQRHDWRRHV